MTTYRNSTKGARAVHFTNGTHKLVEPGALVTVEDGRVKRLAPGFVKAKKGDLPDPPAELVEKVSGEKPLSELSKADLVERAGVSAAEAKKLNRAQLIEKIEAGA